MKPQCFVLFMTVTLLAPQDDAREAAVKRDLEKMQGSWAPVASKQKGRTIENAQLDNLRVAIKENQWRPFVKGEKPFTEYAVKIDPSAKPKTIDLILKDSKTKTPPLGIYEIIGDVLIVAFPAAGEAERPKDFKSGPGSKVQLTIYMRVPE